MDRTGGSCACGCRTRPDVVLSEARDLHLPREVQVPRFAQDDIMDSPAPPPQRMARCFHR